MAILTGVFKIGRDAENRFLPNGEVVCNVSMVYNYGKKGQDGKKPSQWVDASLWGTRAEALSQYLVKGTSIFAVLEDIHIEVYAKKDGTSGTKLTGKIGNLDIVSRPQGDNASDAAPVPAVQKKVVTPVDDLDDDIPF
jgi:single-strand DNA-binding protein